MSTFPAAQRLASPVKQAFDESCQSLVAGYYFV
jgi:hypothetical protein